MSVKDDFLGRGWTFPLRKDNLNVEAGAYDSIEKSIILILGTIKGERVMRPTFGCNIHKLIFEPNTRQTHNAAKWAVTEALEEWEPRINIIDVQVSADTTDKSQINILIIYEVISANTERNLVYPFYLNG